MTKDESNTKNKKNLANNFRPVRLKTYQKRKNEIKRLEDQLAQLEGKKPLETQPQPHKISLGTVFRVVRKTSYDKKGKEIRDLNAEIVALKNPQSTEPEQSNNIETVASSSNTANTASILNSRERERESKGKNPQIKINLSATTNSPQWQNTPTPTNDKKFSFHSAEPSEETIIEEDFSSSSEASTSGSKKSSLTKSILKSTETEDNHPAKNKGRSKQIEPELTAENENYETDLTTKNLQAKSKQDWDKVSKDWKWYAQLQKNRALEAEEREHYTSEELKRDRNYYKNQIINLQNDIFQLKEKLKSYSEANKEFSETNEELWAKVQGEANYCDALDQAYGNLGAENASLQEELEEFQNWKNEAAKVFDTILKGRERIQAWLDNLKEQNTQLSQENEGLRSELEKALKINQDQLDELFIFYNERLTSQVKEWISLLPNHTPEKQSGEASNRTISTETTRRRNYFDNGYISPHEIYSEYSESETSEEEELSARRKPKKLQARFKRPPRPREDSGYGKGEEIDEIGEDLLSKIISIEETYQAPQGAEIITTKTTTSNENQLTNYFYSALNYGKELANQGKQTTYNSLNWAWKHPRTATNLFLLGTSYLASQYQPNFTGYNQHFNHQETNGTFTFAGNLTNLAKENCRILRILSKTNPPQVRKTFHKLSFQFHPDKNPDPHAAEAFKIISDCYTIIIANRKRYGRNYGAEPKPENNQTNFFGSPFQANSNQTQTKSKENSRFKPEKNQEATEQTWAEAEQAPNEAVNKTVSEEKPPTAPQDDNNHTNNNENYSNLNALISSSLLAALVASTGEKKQRNQAKAAEEAEKKEQERLAQEAEERRQREEQARKEAERLERERQNRERPEQPRPEPSNEGYNSNNNPPSPETNSPSNYPSTNNNSNNSNTNLTSPNSNFTYTGGSGGDYFGGGTTTTGKFATPQSPNQIIQAILSEANKAIEKKQISLLETVEKKITSLFAEKDPNKKQIYYSYQPQLENKLEKVIQTKTIQEIQINHLNIAKQIKKTIEPQKIQGREWKEVINNIPMEKIPNYKKQIQSDILRQTKKSAIETVAEDLKIARSIKADIQPQPGNWKLIIENTANEKDIKQEWEENKQNILHQSQAAIINNLHSLLGSELKIADLDEPFSQSPQEIPHKKLTELKAYQQQVAAHIAEKKEKLFQTTQLNTVTQSESKWKHLIWPLTLGAVGTVAGIVAWNYWLKSGKVKVGKGMPAGGMNSHVPPKIKLLVDQYLINLKKLQKNGYNAQLVQNIQESFRQIQNLTEQWLTKQKNRFEEKKWSDFQGRYKEYSEKEASL